MSNPSSINTTANNMSITIFFYTFGHNNIPYYSVQKWPPSVYKYMLLILV